MEDGVIVGVATSGGPLLMSRAVTTSSRNTQGSGCSDGSGGSRVVELLVEPTDDC